MKAIKDMTNAELAAFVQSQTRDRGIEVVLSGGACVSIYSDNRYVSKDLDLINTRLVPRKKIRNALQEIGFSESGRYFIHPDTEFFVEFPSGPLSVGSEPVTKIDEYELETGLLRIISPTDCVKDRLAGYYFWSDLQCLEQAALVANVKDIDLTEVEQWSKVENKYEEFIRIRDRLT